MATRIKIRRGATTPTTADLEQFELGLAQDTNRLFIKDGSNVIKEIAAGNANLLDGLDSTGYLQSGDGSAGGTGGQEKMAGTLSFNSSTILSMKSGSRLNILPGATLYYGDVSTSISGSTIITNGSNNISGLITGGSIHSEAGITAVGAITSSGGNVTAYSDKRIKENLEIIPDALSKVCSLTGYTFDRIDIECDKQTGLIAQDVQKILPEAIIEVENISKDKELPDNILTIAYGNMVGLLVESIKELNEKIDKQAKIIEELSK